MTVSPTGSPVFFSLDAKENSEVSEKLAIEMALSKLERLVRNHSPVRQVLESARFCDRIANNSSPVITKFVASQLAPVEKEKMDSLERLDLSLVPDRIRYLFVTRTESIFQRGEYNGFDSKA